jgi:hypothetical protein
VSTDSVEPMESAKDVERMRLSNVDRVVRISNLTAFAGWQTAGRTIRDGSLDSVPIVIGECTTARMVTSSTPI